MKRSDDFIQGIILGGLAGAATALYLLTRKERALPGDDDTDWISEEKRTGRRKQWIDPLSGELRMKDVRIERSEGKEDPLAGM
jgi:hypothetical protein